MRSLQRPAATASGFGRATAATAAVVVAAGALGTFALRGWGRVPWSTPSVPWYHSFPFYLFLDVQLSRWALPAGTVAAAAVLALVALHRGRARWPLRVAAVVALELPLALPVAALRDGPSGWTAPLDSTGEYPAGVGQVHGVAAFLGGFPELLASLPAALVARAAGVVRERAWTSLDAAAFATLLTAASWGFTRGEVERIFQILVPLVLVPAVRQLLAWRARPAVVAALMAAQAVAVELLFVTRW